MDDRKYIVYCHTNKINNKKYIGITSTSVDKRWGKNGSGYKGQLLFYNAIQKYGWNNFEHEILVSDLNSISACNKEIELIKKFNTTNKKYGYNISSGGKAYNGVLNNSKSKKVYQYTLKGVLIETYISVAEASRLTKISYSHICACCKGNRSSAGNYQWSYQNTINSIKQIEDEETRRRESRKRPILQYSLDGHFIKEWKSIKDASTITKINKSSITGCCNNKYKTAGGFQWIKKTSIKIKELIPKALDKNMQIGVTNGKKILKIDKTTNNILKEYCSISEIIRELHCSKIPIMECCKGNRNDFRDYIWKYA